MAIAHTLCCICRHQTKFRDGYQTWVHKAIEGKAVENAMSSPGRRLEGAGNYQEFEFSATGRTQFAPIRQRSAERSEDMSLRWAWEDATYRLLCGLVWCGDAGRQPGCGLDGCARCRRLATPEPNMSGTGRMEKCGSASPSDLVFVPRTRGSKSPELLMESERGSGRKILGAQGRHRATSGSARQVGGETAHAVPIDARPSPSAFSLIPEILPTPMTHARSKHAVSKGHL
jgi:hypothetical protein